MKIDEKEIWIQRILDYKASGLSALKWAEANDVSVHALRNRVRKYKQTNEESSKVKWTSLVAEKQLDDRESKVLKVTLGKAVIEVPTGFDEDTLASLVGILSKC